MHALHISIGKFYLLDPLLNRGYELLTEAVRLVLLVGMAGEIKVCESAGDGNKSSLNYSLVLSFVEAMSVLMRRKKDFSYEMISHFFED